MTHAILMALAPIFIVMAMGYGAGKLRIVDQGQMGGLNALVMDFALPASLFVATASAPRQELIAQAPLFALFGGAMLVVYAVWFLAARLIWKDSRAEASIQALTVAFPNLAGVGLPIISALIGPKGAIPLAVALAAGSILVSPLTLVLLEMTRTDAAVAPARRVLRALRRALTKPVVAAPALGILLSLTELPLNPVAGASLTLIGHAAAGVALFLTGLILSAQPFRLDWEVVGATAAADLLRPLLVAALVLLLALPHDLARTAILLAAAPSGFFGILFAVNYKLDPAETGSMVIASTVFSIVTMSVVIALLF